MSAPAICPFLKEVVMLYCDACPVKKLLPRNQVVSMGPCASREFERCPLYRELAHGMPGRAAGVAGRDGLEGAEERP